MEPPPLGKYTVQPPSKKRDYPGGDLRSKSAKPREEALCNFSYKRNYSANGESGVHGQHKSSDSESYFHDHFYDNNAYYDNLTYNRDYAPQAHFDSRNIFPQNPQTEVKSSNHSNSNVKIEPNKLNPASNMAFNFSSSASSVYPNPRPEMDKNSYPYVNRPPIPLPSYYNNTTPITHGSTAHYSSYGFGPSYATSYPYSTNINSIGNNNLPYPPAPPLFMSPSPMLRPLSSYGTPRSSWLDGLYTPFFASGEIFSPAGALPLSYERESSSQFSQDPAGKNAVAAGSSSGPLFPNVDVNEKDIIEKYQNFKQFDTVEDFSDHHFQNSVSAAKRPPKDWSKRIQEEWKILEKNLPDTIYVRVCESRIDLLRAAIIGAEGTPYHDGLFFFDIFFPSSYPNVPPHVNYHSGGLGINPNLYNCGKVCLSLLNTWEGYHQNELWIPGVSTILQVLVSIQALILNEKPYFNEPGFEDMLGSSSGEMQSQQYNESVFILSLRTMVYSIRKPPKHFEDFVVGHFFKRAQDILGACKAYLEGVQVGSLVNGGATVDTFNKDCSQSFRDLLVRYIRMLVEIFSQIGIKDLGKFVSLAEGRKSQISYCAPSELINPNDLIF